MAVMMCFFIATKPIMELCDTPGQLLSLCYFLRMVQVSNTGKLCDWVTTQPSEVSFSADICSGEMSGVIAFKKNHSLELTKVTF